MRRCLFRCSTSVVPTGLMIIRRYYPSDESLGYFRLSLRDI
jgi:hypothetical protein